MINRKRLTGNIKPSITRHMQKGGIIALTNVMMSVLVWKDKACSHVANKVG